MKNHILIASLLLSVTAFANASDLTESGLTKAAKTGDLKAQRNLSFSYAVGVGAPGQPKYIPKNLDNACTWFRVILISKSPDVAAGDYSNDWTYCRNLDLVASSNAWDSARKIASGIK